MVDRVVVFAVYNDMNDMNGVNDTNDIHRLIYDGVDAVRRAGPHRNVVERGSNCCFPIVV